MEKKFYAEILATAREVVKFINENKIPRENIVGINCVPGALSSNFVLFYYK